MEKRATSALIYDFFLEVLVFATVPLAGLRWGLDLPKLPLRILPRRVLISPFPIFRK